MTSKIAITNGIIYTERDVFRDHALLIRGAQIVDIVKMDQIPPDYRPFDAGGKHVTPGFIDLQIYGGGGVLFAERPTKESLATMTEALIHTGTTSFYLTLATNTEEIFNASIEVLKEYHPSACLGLHFEGPFLNELKKGAHPSACLEQPTNERIQKLLARADGKLKMLTIAPELFDESTIKLLLEANILLSAGHSNASYEQATSGFNLGIQAVTHLYNAMSSFHHRDIGLPGATFQHSRVCASVIADGIHVSYEALKVSKKLLGERLFLITDAVEETSEGVYIHKRNGDHFTLPDGTLSGSALTQLVGIKNCVMHAGIPIDEAIRMATWYPAKLIGDHSIGAFTSGARANICIFNDDFELEHVLFNGEIQ
jgi:N-acetylglucosamine-6-phosphate deacetylase